MTFPPPQLEKSWQEALKEEWDKPYLRDLAAYVVQERESYPVYPSKQDVFNAFTYAPYDKVKVVIVGQDPYHGPGQAHGLSFSVRKGVPQPPSLKNIFKEIEQDLGIPPPSHGCLEEWAHQGVLLLNASLTVRAREPHSHHGKGWETFTDSVIAALCKREDPVIFVLWGKSAQEKCHQITIPERHTVLTAAHPSPYSAHAGFFGCHHFSKIDELLKKQGKEPIKWAIA